MPQIMTDKECVERNLSIFNSPEDKQVCGDCKKELNEDDDVYYVLFNFRFEPKSDQHDLSPKFGNVATEIIGHFGCIQKIYQEISKTQHTFFTKENKHHKKARIEVNRRFNKKHNLGM